MSQDGKQFMVCEVNTWKQTAQTADRRLKSATEVAQLVYAGNQVLLNRDDLIYDTCRLLCLAKPDHMLVAVPRPETLSNSEQTNEEKS